MSLRTKLPDKVSQALKKLGSDINEARRRRQITTTAMSRKAKISRPTLTKVEQGHAGVSVGNYASILYVLGMADRVADIADISHDQIGVAMTRKQLPQRVRSSKPRLAKKRSK